MPSFFTCPHFSLCTCGRDTEQLFHFWALFCLISSRISKIQKRLGPRGIIALDLFPPLAFSLRADHTNRVDTHPVLTWTASDFKMEKKSEEGDQVTAALHTCAWLIWRDFIYDNEPKGDNKDYLEKMKENLFHWLKGVESIPSDYCACYEQICDFSMIVGNSGSVEMMRQIVSKIETADNYDQYEKRIANLLEAFELPDTKETRMNMERIYAASTCYSYYQSAIAGVMADAMKAGESVLDTKINERVAELYNNVIEHAQKKPLKPSLQSDLPAEAPDSEQNKFGVFREYEIRRRSTRRNLSDLQQQMILMKKEELDPAKRSKRSKRSKREKWSKREKKKSKHINGDDPGSDTIPSKSKSKWGRARMPSMKRKKTHKRSASEMPSEKDSGPRRLRGFNLSQGACEPSSPREDGVSAAVVEDEHWNDSSERGRSGAVADREDASADSEPKEPVRDDVFYRHLAGHFVKQVWTHLRRESHVSGMSGFLTKYRLPRFSITTSEDMRIDAVTEALGECAKKNFIRHIIVKVCRANCADEIAHIRDQIMNGRSWTEDCDHHTMMAAVFSRCGRELHAKFGYLAEEYTKSLREVGNNPEMTELLKAMRHAYEEYDDALEDLRFAYNPPVGIDTADIMKRSRSDSQVPAFDPKWNDESESSEPSS